MEKVMKREKHHYWVMRGSREEEGINERQRYKRGIVRDMKAAEEKHQSGGKGCWHRRLGPLLALPPRVRARNP